MRALTLLILCCLAYSFSYAQDFRSIPKETIAHYKYKDSLNCYGGYCIVGYRTDSIYGDLQGESYKFHKIVRKDGGLPGNCELSVTDETWIGSQYILIYDDRDVFFNKNGDSIILRRYLSAGIPWKMFDLGNGNYIEAITDSVKGGNPNNFNYYFDTQFISLTAKDDSGNVIPHPLNGIVLKKAFWQGLYETVSFYDFPDDTTIYTWAGATNPPSGFDTLNVDAYAIFNYELGHEFHYERRKKTPAGDTLTREKLFVISKYVSAAQDTLIYEYRRARLITVSPDGNGAADSTFIVDTLKQTIALANYAYLNLLGNEFMPNGKYGTGFMKMFYNEEYHGRYQKIPMDNYVFDSANSCLFDGSANLPRHEYANGLGQTYYYSEGLIPSIYEYRELVFYQKGLEEWGVPYDFSLYATGIVEKPVTHRINFYPNPADMRLVIDMPLHGSESALISILDLTGRRLLQQSGLKGSKVTVDISSLPKGMFIIEMIVNDLHFQGKFIKN